MQLRHSILKVIAYFDLFDYPLTEEDILFFLDRPTDRWELAAALEAAMAGLVVVHPSAIAVALPAPSAALSPLAELAEPLTPREREVLEMLASGLVNKEIAAKLSISEHTVKFHVASILGKLGAATRTEAVSLGFRRGLVLL